MGILPMVSNPTGRMPIIHSLTLMLTATVEPSRIFAAFAVNAGSDLSTAKNAKSHEVFTGNRPTRFICQTERAAAPEKAFAGAACALC